MKLIKTLTVLAATVCCGAITSQATLVNVGDQNITVSSGANVPGGSAFTSTFLSANGALNGYVESWAVANPISGDLTFYYEIFNIPSGGDIVEHLSVGGFAGLITDVSYVAMSGIDPTQVNRSGAVNHGNTITFDFTSLGAIGTGANSVIVAIATDYSGPVETTSAGILNNAGATATVLAVPEPTTIMAGAMLLLPFGVSTLRGLRRKLSA